MKSESASRVYPLLLRQALEAMKMSTTDEVVRENSLREAAIYLLNEKWTKILPELVPLAYEHDAMHHFGIGLVAGITTFMVLSTFF